MTLLNTMLLLLCTMCLMAYVSPSCVIHQMVASTPATITMRTITSAPTATVQDNAIIFLITTRCCTLGASTGIYQRRMIPRSYTAMVQIIMEATAESIRHLPTALHMFMKGPIHTPTTTNKTTASSCIDQRTISRTISLRERVIKMIMLPSTRTTAMATTTTTTLRVLLRPMTTDWRRTAGRDQFWNTTAWIRVGTWGCCPLIRHLRWPEATKFRRPQ
mmetsp:Transcript_2415/g.6717  ORF Transcript_2415/g.6717 Transcript_2415/m.6717 type:complete len:218 (+) Transcript_2415:88-741(+)